MTNTLKMMNWLGGASPCVCLQESLVYTSGDAREKDSLGSPTSLVMNAIRLIPITILSSAVAFLMVIWLCNETEGN